MDWLDEIKERVAKATPGEWTVTADGWQVTSADCNICGTYHAHRMHDGGRWDEPGFPVQPDADFIAHARTDIPRLIEALESARASVIAEVVEALRRQELGDSRYTDSDQLIISVGEAVRRVRSLERGTNGD